MNGLRLYTFIILISILTANSENITTFLNNAPENGESGRYLNSFLNISKNEPELIEYYDLEEVTTAPEIIYPDPDTMFNSKKKENLKTIPNMSSTKLNGDTASEFDLNSREHVPSDGGKGVDDAVNGIGGVGGGFQNMLSIADMKNEDLREHDIIDNIMYIYYGSSVALRKSLGGSIIIVGTVFALAAQILAVIFTMLRNRRLRRTNYLASISMNLLMTLCASNLVFIVGVQASKNIFKCEMIAILLHYFHLSTAIWCLSHSFAIYDFVINENAPVLKYNNLMAYGGSAVFVLFSFAVSSTSYETFEFCWMSVQRGMIINFMIPISALIVATTIFGTLTLRTVVSKQRQVIVESIENILDKCQHIDAAASSANSLANVNGVLGGDLMPSIKCCDEMEKMCDADLKRIDFYDSKFDLGALSIADLSLQSSSDSQDYADFKRAVKFSLFFQPAFSVCWFLGVVALENRQSCIMPVTFIICYNILSWYILYRSPYISPVIIPQSVNGDTASNGNKLSNQFDSNYSISDEINPTPSCTDTIPLLCSVTGASLPGANLQKQSSLDDMVYKPPSNSAQWENSMENINLDCISTISN